MKKIACSLLIVVIIISMCMTISNAVTLTITPRVEESSVHPEEQVHVAVDIGSVDGASSDVGFSKIEFSIDYDEDVFEDITETSFGQYTGWGVSFDSSTNTATFTSNPADGIKVGTITSMTLKVKKSVSISQESTISLKNIKAYYEEDEISVANSSANVNIVVENNIGAQSGDEVSWTSFSNAKYTIKKDGVSGAIIEISGVTPRDLSNYYMYITPNGDKPNVNGSVNDGNISLTYDKNSKVFKTIQTDKVANYVELNQDLYVSVLESSGSKTNIVDYGKKLTRFEEPKYNDAFHATFLTESSDQIVTMFTHNQANDRKMQIKIGKVTDTSILQKIKDKDASGFSGLMSFAKSNKAIFDQTVDADKNDFFAIEYNAGNGSSTGKSVLKVNGIEKDQYYYLYVKTDDENGKYTSNEAVTLAKGTTYSNGYGLFFYGASDFKWTDWGSSSGGSSSGGTTSGGTSKDNTVAPTQLPNTGASIAIILSMAGVIALGAIGGVKIYKYKDIK